MQMMRISTRLKVNYVANRKNNEHEHGQMRFLSTGTNANEVHNHNI
jgi:hypothetical protein